MSNLSPDATEMPNAVEAWSLTKNRRRTSSDETNWRKLIDKAQVSDWQRQFLIGEWLQRLMDIQRGERKDGNLFIVLRAITILGALAVSAFTSVSGELHYPAIRWTVFALGFLVAATSAIEQLAHYGDHRLLRRRTREELKREGWNYFCLLDPYKESHASAFDVFAVRVERILVSYNRAYDRTLSGDTSPANGSQLNAEGSSETPVGETPAGDRSPTGEGDRSVAGPDVGDQPKPQNST